MILRSGFIAFLFTLCLLGCSPTTKPLVWKAKDIAISDFQAFEIRPVINATDKHIKQEILSFLTASLKKQFEVKNLQLIDSPETISEVLTVQSEILVYEVTLFMSPAPPSKYMIALCILRTRLLQKSSSNVVAEIVTVNKIDVGQGLFEPKNPEYVLQESAAAVAKEVARMM
jgi:hypothetical protein